MDGQLVLSFILIMGGLLVLMAIGVHIALCFLIITLIGAIIFWGYDAGINLALNNIRVSLAAFYLMPIIMFVLMGNVMFYSGMGSKMLDAISRWLGRLPGRLALLSVAFCTLFATMSGSQIATTSMMGTLLTPDMEKHGYKKAMSIGSVIGAGGLAMIIPPSSMAVILGVVGNISIGKLLISGIIPGLLLAFFYALYIIFRCKLQPSIAPPYDVTTYSFTEKVVDTFKYVIPLLLIVFLVLGLILLGWATPSESAVAGAIGAFILAIFYKKFNWNLIKKSTMLTVSSAGGVLIIIAGSVTFSQILAYSGVSRYLAQMAVSLPIAPIVLIILMQLLLVFLGCFMGTVPMIMITIPIFMPIVLATHFDPIAFGLVTLINLETSGITPPVGMSLFVMKTVSPQTPMMEIYKAGVPFVLINILLMALVLAFPTIASWLPSIIHV